MLLLVSILMKDWQALGELFTGYSGFAGSAVPFAWYTPTSTANKLAYGNCSDGISGKTGEVPTLNGEPLCYQLTNIDNGNKLKIQVMETCGGNCGADDPDIDCATIGKDQYISTNRDYPSQLCPRYSDQNISGNPKLAAALTYKTTSATCTDNLAHKDWCGGYFTHFDVDQEKISGMMGPWDSPGIVTYKKIPCKL